VTLRKLVLWGMTVMQSAARYSSLPKMYAVRSYEMSVYLYQCTRHKITEKQYY